MKEKGWDANPQLITTHVKAMVNLIQQGKSPFIAHKLENTVAKGALDPHRMPYGLIENQIEFFDADNIQQVNYIHKLLIFVFFIYYKTLISLMAWGNRSFYKAAPQLWNLLPLNLRQSATLTSLKCGLKTHLFRLAYN